MVDIIDLNAPKLHIMASSSKPIHLEWQSKLDYKIVIMGHFKGLRQLMMSVNLFLTFVPLVVLLCIGPVLNLLELLLYL